LTVDCGIMSYDYITHQLLCTKTQWRAE